MANIVPSPSLPLTSNESQGNDKTPANLTMVQSRRFSHDPYKPSLLDISRKEPVRHEPTYETALSQEYYRKLKYPGSEWILLFYDLAWTATFASLAQHGKFVEPMELLSYFAFFAAVLWLWASQTLYSIHFYTNDWFHFTSIFLQLFLFGMLAATTNGYDISAYISHTPGSEELITADSQLTGAEELEIFGAKKTHYLSAQVIALAFALTRFLHLAQYLRACYYARWGKGNQHRKKQVEETWDTYIHQLIHPQIYAIVVGLIFSNMIFFAVVGIVFSDFGTTVTGASLKVGLWVGGFLLEILSHLWDPIRLRNPIYRLQRDHRNISPLPVGEVNLSKRLDTITTIILGEGINGFAQTLSSILTAPGVGRAIAVNVVSAAFIIWFVAYIYFEGPTSGSSPADEGLRRMAWMLLYLPLLASIFLLFMGIKSQFMVTAFLSTLKVSARGFYQMLVDEGFPKNLSNTTLWQSKRPLKDFLFARGIVWADEYKTLLELRNNSTTNAEWRVNLNSWLAKLSLSMALHIHKSFNGEEIPTATQELIDEYRQADKATLARDYEIQDPQESVYYRILTELLGEGLDGVRYIIVFAAVILLSVGLQGFIHTKEFGSLTLYKKRIVISRLLMGVVLSLLLLLNIGKHQEYFVISSERGQRAGVFQWLDVFWVLPTIAIAYGVQFIIETSLTFFGKPVASQEHITSLSYHGGSAQHDGSTEEKD